MNLAIQLTGLDAVASGWANAPAMMVDELAAFATGAAQFMQGEIQEKMPPGGHGVAHGTLKASFIVKDTERLADGVIGQVGTSLNYAIPVELGTKPHFPPVQAIADWVKVKLGISGPEGQRIAFAIARKISKKGTQGAHMVERAFDSGRAQVERQFADAIERIKRRLAEGHA